MISVSNEFKEFMKQSSDFRPHADITFPDGRTLSLSTPDLSVTGNTVSDSASSSGIPLGAAISRSIQLQILNPDEKYKDYDFYGAEIHLYTTAQLSETVERIENGRFTVTSPEDYGTTITFTAFDVMYRADKPYATSLLFPATVGSMLRDICTTCKIPIGTGAFENDDFVVEKAPDGNYTFRQIIGYIAMIAGGNARINRDGYLEIMAYNLDFSGNFHDLKNWKDIRVGSDDIVVTEIRTAGRGENDEEIIYAASRVAVQTDAGEDVLTNDGQLVLADLSVDGEGYTLSVENPLIAGKEQQIVNFIADKLAMHPFRKFDGEHICYPLAEFMDAVKVYDWRGNSYRSFITDVDFVFFGFTSLKNSAENAIRSGSTYSSPGATLITEAKGLIAKEKSDRELAQTQLQNQLDNSRGMYTDEIPQEDGGSIYYVHDKPTLEESRFVTKYTADAIGLSTDGGKTYPYGFVMNGDIIARYLYTVGINANYIDAGALTVRDSADNIIFSADKDAKTASIAGWEVGDGYIRKKDASNKYVGIGTRGKAFAFYAGATAANGSDAVFRVDHSGELLATNAVIKGSIEATSINIHDRSEYYDMKFVYDQTRNRWILGGSFNDTVTTQNETLIEFYGNDQVQTNDGGKISASIRTNKLLHLQGGTGVYIDSSAWVTGGLYAKSGLSVTGEIASTGNITCNEELYVSGWIRSTGTNGIYWQNYAGGWYMNDSNWIRAWNNKGIHTEGTIYGGGMNVGTNKDTAYLNLGNNGALIWAQNRDGNIFFRYRASASASYSYANVKDIIAVQNTKLSLTGGTMTGNINFTNGHGPYNSTNGGYLIRDNGSLTGVGNTVRKTSIWSSDNQLYLKETSTTFTKSGSSDKRVKTDIQVLSDMYKDFYMSITPYTFRYKIDEDSKTHFGYMAQDVASAAKKYSLPDDNNLWEETEPMGDALKYVGENDKLLRINYLEWVPLNTFMIQMLYKKVLEIEKTRR